jgi:hypothetical protein
MEGKVFFIYFKIKPATYTQVHSTSSCNNLIPSYLFWTAAIFFLLLQIYNLNQINKIVKKKKSKNVCVGKRSGCMHEGWEEEWVHAWGLGAGAGGREER